jgi:peptide/nickel transport system substrate-binding protein
MLAACAVAPRPAAPAQNTAEVTPAVQPSVLTLAMPRFSSAFVDLDPSQGISGEHVLHLNTHETLLRYNPPGSAEPFSPGLATQWNVSEDGKTWTFTLRQGVKFHDGASFNAEAVKTSIERTKKLNGPPAFIWSPVKEIKVVDEYTVAFEMDNPAPLDLIASAAYGAFIMSPAAASQDGAWFQAGNEAGTGPYKVEKFGPDRIILTRFDDYWGGWKDGQFDKIVFEEVPDASVRRQKIEAGEIDWASDIPRDSLTTLDARPDVKIVPAATFRNTQNILNTQKGPLKDVRVRKALAHSFPYDAFIKTALAGYGTQAKGPVPAGMLGHNPNIQPYAYDLDKARQLLKEAGYENGGFELTMTYGAGISEQEQAAELWQPELAKLGITLIPKPLTWDAQWALAKSDPDKAQDILETMWFPTYVTPYDFLFNLFHSEEQTNFNFAYYDNPKYDQMIDEANVLLGTDKAEAERMFQQAQQLLMDDAVAIFLCDIVDVFVIREDLKGFSHNPAYQGVVFAYELSR